MCGHRWGPAVGRCRPTLGRATPLGAGQLEPCGTAREPEGGQAAGGRVSAVCCKVNRRGRPTQKGTSGVRERKENFPPHRAGLKFALRSWLGPRTHLHTGRGFGTKMTHKILRCFTTVYGPYGTHRLAYKSLLSAIRCHYPGKEHVVKLARRRATGPAPSQRDARWTSRSRTPYCVPPSLQAEGPGPVQCPKFGKLAKHGKGLCIWGEGAFLGELGGAAE